MIALQPKSDSPFVVYMYVLGNTTSQSTARSRYFNKNSMSEPMLVQSSCLVFTSDRTVNDWTVQI